MARTVVNFDGIAAAGSTAPLASDYSSFHWNHFVARGVGPDDQGVAYNLDGGAARISSDEPFALLRGTFAAAWDHDLKVTFIAYLDGQRVAHKTVVLDQDAMVVTFNDKFSHIDSVKIITSGGVDADAGDGGSGPVVNMDRLVFDDAPVAPPAVVDHGGHVLFGHGHVDHLFNPRIPDLHDCFV